ncbi:MAG: hypothetical protein WKI04_17310 [Ferruginibacter sp.]
MILLSEMKQKPHTEAMNYHGRQQSFPFEWQEGFGAGRQKNSPLLKGLFHNVDIIFTSS